MKDLQHTLITVAMDLALAVAIGCTFAGALVMWWSA